MAIFEHANHSLTYAMRPAPFAADLVLLQGTRFTPVVWQPVLDGYALGPEGGGRILTLDLIGDSEGMGLLFTTLGLHRIHVVACDDAVAVMEQVQRASPYLFAKTLFFANGAPNGESLAEAVRVLCPAQSGS